MRFSDGSFQVDFSELTFGGRDCEWNGAPERNGIGCTGSCGPGKFELNQDTAADASGFRQCNYGTRKLCCQSTKLIDDCNWTGCDGPLFPDESPACPDGTVKIAHRYNRPDRDGMCYETYNDGKGAHPNVFKSFKSSLCCPKEHSFGNCNWSNNPPIPVESRHLEQYCLPHACQSNQIQVAEAKNPPDPPHMSNSGSFLTCDGVMKAPGTDPHFPLCCDPPSIWNKDWPVDPEKLWENHFSNKDNDKAVWAYDTQYHHNDQDKNRASPHAIDGTDAYGFLMLNGAEEAIDDTFDKSMTVVSASAAPPKTKREILTNNQTLIDKVFEHAEETFYAYCNFPPGSIQCESLFAGGAEDTIIRLPAHVGEGPFARVVSVEPASGQEFELPGHHTRHRLEKRLSGNSVYKFKIDYNFHLARQDRGPVNIRVDYTNLLGYWNELTDSPPSRSRIKRGLREDEDYTIRNFRSRVQRAEVVEKKLNKRSGHVIKSTVPFGEEDLHLHNLNKRWWGAFTEWLKRLTTLTTSEKGDLPLSWADSINIFKAKWGCPGKTWSANLRMDLEAELNMQATYAYYFSSTFIPPSKPDAFFYFGIEPTAYVGVTLVGSKCTLPPEGLNLPIADWLPFIALF